MILLHRGEELYSADHCGRGTSSTIATASVADEGAPPRLTTRRSRAVNAPPGSCSAGNIQWREQLRSGKRTSRASSSRSPRHKKTRNSVISGGLGSARPASDTVNGGPRTDGVLLKPCSAHLGQQQKRPPPVQSHSDTAKIPDIPVPPFSDIELKSFSAKKAKEQAENYKNKKGLPKPKPKPKPTIPGKKGKMQAASSKDVSFEDEEEEDSEPEEDEETDEATESSEN